MKAAQNIRQRARDDFLREIRTIARQHLAQHGPEALSLRAVAREMGIASSALYRYFPIREALLNTLVDDAHHSAAESVERQVAGCDPDSPAIRWRTACHELRAWAHDHPNEFALLHSPAPGLDGYAAPGPAASRIPLLLVDILRDASGPDPYDEPPGPVARHGASTRADTSTDHREAGAPPPAVVLRMLTGWTQLIGAITLEIRGHLHGIRDDAFFSDSVDLMMTFLLPPSTSAEGRNDSPARG